MKILMIASEVYPFSKTGGLADVMGALPRALSALGHDVHVIAPKYRHLNTEDWRCIYSPLSVKMGSLGEFEAHIYRHIQKEITIDLIQSPQFFERQGYYHDKDGRAYEDNDLRFSFLCLAALKWTEVQGIPPDVLHVHDWQGASAILALRLGGHRNDFWKNTKTLLTIHNIQYQGVFPPDRLFDVLGIDPGFFHMESLEFYGQINLLKGGILYADKINTVSQKYALEIQTPEFGYGLEGVIQKRSRDLSGIVNGIDLDIWNPQTDPHIAKPYSAEDLSGKAICKAELQEEMGLPVRSVPLIGMIGRLVEQKGYDVVAAALPQILSMDVQMVLLGSGEAWAHQYFSEASQRFSERFAAFIGYDDPLAHRIEAGADFFLMPSRFEPCGLNQLYSMRYGTLPIVHATGGLDDTVENFNAQAQTGTGFKFWDLNPKALFNTIGWAVYTFYNEAHSIKGLIQRAMNRDFSWQKSAQKYLDLYQSMKI